MGKEIKVVGLMYNRYDHSVTEITKGCMIKEEDLYGDLAAAIHHRDEIDAAIRSMRNALIPVGLRPAEEAPRYRDAAEVVDAINAGQVPGFEYAAASMGQVGDLEIGSRDLISIMPKEFAQVRLERSEKDPTKVRVVDPAASKVGFDEFEEES